MQIFIGNVRIWSRIQVISLEKVINYLLTRSKRNPKTNPKPKQKSKPNEVVSNKKRPGSDNRVEEMSWDLITASLVQHLKIRGGFWNESEFSIYHI